MSTEKPGFTGASSDLVERVTLRLTKDQLAEIDALVEDDDSEFENRSHAFRNLLPDLLHDQTRAMYVVSDHQGGVKRHKPDDGTTIEPSCHAQSDHGWRLKTARQTVFYDDCQQCYPGGDGA